jgi:PAS domain S-box-containing protein
MKALGKDPDALVGKLLWEEFPNLPNEQALRRAMSERVSVVDEMFYPALGEWVENHIYPTHDGGLVVYARYVTERKRHEEALRRTEAHLVEGQRLSQTASWTWNVATGALSWSRQNFYIFGFDPAAAPPSHAQVMTRIHPDDRAFFDQTMERAIREKTILDLEYRIVRPDGSVRFLRSLGHPIVSEAGELDEFIGTVMDLTERKHAEEALREAQAELARVIRVTTMGELAASIAHELNQPLAAVVTNAQAALRWLDAVPANDFEVRAAIERIVRDGSRGGEVLHRIRAFVKREPPCITRMRIADVVNEVLNLVQPQLQAEHIPVSMQSDAELPLVEADRVQLQQVILNLVLNAIDAMKPVSGRPPQLEIVIERDGPDALRVSVIDSGSGFDPRRTDHLFDAFYTTKPGGLGMGLAICRSIVEAHGGRIWASQQSGQGATFRFTLPT